MNRIPYFLVTGICFLNVFTLQAQDYGMGKQKIGRPSRWAVGVMVSPDFGGHFILPTNTDDAPEAAHLTRSAEHPTFGFTTGLQITYDLKSRWFARLGIYYSDKAISTDGFVTGFNTASGFLKINSGGGRKPFGFLEFPLTFHYFLNTPFEKNKKGLCFNDFTQHNKGKPLFYVFAGPALAVNATKHIYDTRRWTNFNDTLFENTIPVYADPFTVFYLGMYAGIGVLKYFGNHWYIHGELTLRYFPFNWYGRKLLQEDAVSGEPVPQAVPTFPVKDMPYSVGLQVGVNYHF